VIIRKSRMSSLVLAATTPVALAALALAPACSSVTHPATPSPATAATTSGHAQPAAVPHYAHIVVVMEENHSYSQIIGSSSAPYINSLATANVLFTNSHAITHPSEPNYMAFTSGSTYGLTSDACPFTTSHANLGSELIAAGKSYSDYSESMPSQGYEGCTSGEYARKHNPAANYTDLPAASNNTWTSFPASGSYGTLPAVSFVAPNLLDDMHDGTVAQGDTWLKNNMSSYVTWAASHNSLLIVTWDENDGSAGNQVATIFAGAHLKPGSYSEKITHYTVLRTIEAAYGLTPLGKSAKVSPITDVFS
jgi:phosphatidylinositol-3-phosphatase